jgi:hypothetical protein
VRGRWASAITASRPAARQISSPSPSAASPTDLFHFATLKRKTAVTEDASSRIVRPKTLPPASSASDRRLLVQRAVRWPGHCGIDGAMREAAFDDLVAWVENGTVPAGDDVLGDVRQLGLRWTLLRHPKDLQQ